MEKLKTTEIRNKVQEICEQLNCKMIAVEFSTMYPIIRIPLAKNVISTKLFNKLGKLFQTEQVVIYEDNDTIVLNYWCNNKKFMKS